MTLQRERPKFFAALVGTLTLAAWPTPAAAETVRVKAIRVSESAGETAVVIAASARPTFTTWKLEQPARVVVELSGARLGNVDVPMDAGTYAVGLVSASVTEDDSAGARTRIVLTLRQTSDYQVETKGNDITLHVVPRVRAATATVAAVATSDGAAVRREAEARAKAEARLASEALAKEQAEAQARSETQAKLAAEARAKTEADAKTKAQALARSEEKAKNEAVARAESEAEAKLAAVARAESEAKAKLEAQALAQAQTKVAAQAQAEGEKRARGETAAKLEADRLRHELSQAQREVAQAKAEATAANEESRRQQQALAQAETRIQEAQAESESARKRAQAAESEALAARRREAERDHALHGASAEVVARQTLLDQIARKQEEQQSRLANAEHLVKDREAQLRASESKLAERDREAQAARLRKDKLARDASEKSKTDAAATLATAERERKNALAVAEQARKELAQADASRRQEEARREEQASLRRAEENRLNKAISQRKAEEARLEEARAERSRLDDDRAKLDAERARLEVVRNELLADVSRLKAAASAPKVAMAKTMASPVTATKATTTTTTATATKAAFTKSAPPTLTASAPPTRAEPTTAIAPGAKPRSITLRAMSHVRSIDFVDEPSRASVIIDIDDSTNFTIERLAGRRLSLRLEHSELPESLARNLDATEYLGPVKIISSYCDPLARGTVRVDVDLAEDVPNRIRVDGNRIFWDFQKAQTKAPSLPAMWAPPSTTTFVPARKLAGFIVTLRDGLWTSQAIPPYLAPPVQSAPDTSAAPGAASASAAPAGSQDTRASGSTGQGSGGGGRYSAIGKKRYTGRRIDLDFKGADIHNILRLLADVGQVNVIVADDVRGEVTIKMRDVPWDQALDVVLRSKGLGSVREGNLLRVAPLALLEKELEAEIARQKQVADVLPLETRLIGVSYADAAQLLDKIRDLLSPRGKVSQDHRTNTLIVSDVSKNLQLIEDLVRNLDTQTSQVVIEARIVEANSNFSRQIGVQWGGTAFADSAHGNPTGLVFPYNVGVGGGADDPAASISGLVPGPRTGTGTTGNPNFLVNMPAPAGLGTGSAIGLTLGSVAGAFNLNLRLSAMESTGQVRILSSPRITTMDNIEAHIMQGVSIPVSVVSAMGAMTQFVDAQLSLGVKPHVTNEGTISMTVSITRNEPDFVNTGARGDPTIQKKEAKTTMLVRDGDTAVIGGIYTRNTGLAFTRVPFFSDIPVLGWFFRNRKENDNRTEFLVFITPRIANRSRVAGQ
jgi:type IV pilus assembly protein PilQ